MNIDPTLEAQYRAALYRVFDGARIVTTRIDRREPRIAALLARHGACSGVLMTAWNPQSRPTPAAANAARQAEFEAWLNRAGIGWVPAEGRSVSGDWVEPGVLAFDLDAATAARLALRFDQTAWVAYDATGTGRLVYAGAPTPSATMPLPESEDGAA